MDTWKKSAARHEWTHWRVLTFVENPPKKENHWIWLQCRKYVLEESSIRILPISRLECLYNICRRRQVNASTWRLHCRSTTCRMRHYDQNVVKLLLICDASRMPPRNDQDVVRIWSIITQRNGVNCMNVMSLENSPKALRQYANITKTWSS